MLHVRLSAFMLAVLVALGGIPSGAGADATKFDDRLLQVLSDTTGPVGAIVTTHGPPEAAADAARSLGGDIVWVYDIIDGFSLKASRGVLDVLSLRSDVERIWLDRPMTTVMDNSAYAIESDKAWAAGIDGSGLSVAVIDTGIDSLHPFFSGAISACVSTIGGLVSPECTDSDGHGTHVAGTVASRDSKYPGVAPGASLAVVRVL
ncbi:MAG: S8 family serine peptidase, partial [Euryarchaeota archaeon]|nr:S8 family serine peptidase [Euryarchaeota archaeon]